MHAPGDLLQTILDSATDYAIFTLDRDNTISSWNRGAENLLGWSADEAIGRSGEIIFTPEDIEARAPEAEQANALADGRWEDERWHVRRDGSRFWASGLIMPLRGEGRAFLKILRDRTEEHKAQEALKDSERRFRSLAEHIPQLVFRSLSTGLRTWGSPQWVHFTGLSLPESLGTGWVEAVHPEDRKRTMKAWTEAQRSGEYYVEHRIRRAADGDYRWFQTRATPLRDPEGVPYEWVGTSTDIHDMRLLQNRQQVLLAELQHRTRNLLAIVQSFARQTMRAATSMDDFRRRFTDRLLALSRVQGLLSRVDETPITTREIITSELGAHGTENGGQITLKGPPLELPAQAVQALALAIHELSTNALKYGALAASGGHLDITWDVVPQDGARWLVLRWEESGISISPEKPQQSRGFGMQLIEKGLPHDLNARTRIEFRPHGVECLIEVPLGPA